MPRPIPTLSAALLVLAILGLGACSLPSTERRDGPGPTYRDVSRVPDAVPRVEPRSRGGNAASYVVFGKRYHTMKDSRGFRERGIASWYGYKFHGRKTANGETYDMYTMSAAHKRLSIPTYVEVTNLENGRKVIVRVNDRGPFHANRIIDLSYAAAARIGMLKKGTALVEVRAIDPSARTRPRRATAPKPARAAAPPPRNTAAPAPRIWLQAGAFSSNDNAERLRNRLQRNLSTSVRITAADSAGGRVHRVQVGPLASVDSADRISQRLGELGIGSPIVVID